MPGLWMLGCLGKKAVGDLLQQRDPSGGGVAPGGAWQSQSALQFLPKGAIIQGRMVAAMGVISRAISAYQPYTENRLNLAGGGLGGTGG